MSTMLAERRARSAIAASWPNRLSGIAKAIASVLVFGALIGASQPAAAQFTQKLVGSGVVGTAQQGFGVALSGDGNTAIVGGWLDNSFVGAAWVYTQSGGVWTQQGSKLVGTGATGKADQGLGVALSADGNTAVVGGPSDNSSVGATWVFTRSGGVWTQQGSKLVGTGAVGMSNQGSGVALSADGNTAVVGGDGDNSGIGATWVFTRSGSTWTQQGSKLVGTGAVGEARQGDSVALSGDGIVGGYLDNSGIGAAWVFAAPYFNPTATHDFNGDGYSDIAWRGPSGDVAIWFMNGTQIVSTSDFINVPASWTIQGANAD
jgi:hypothetical protein